MTTPTRTQCKWCKKEFGRLSNLGRHYDTWVYRVNPALPDNVHTSEAIEEMEALRRDVRRYSYAGTRDKKLLRSQQNKRSYARNRDKYKASQLEKHNASMANAMALKEIEKEANIKARIYAHLEPTADSEPSLLNFATIVFQFLPHPALPPSESGRPNQENPSRSWRPEIPGRREYTALCLLLHPDHHPELGSAWMQRLISEWHAWEALDVGEKAKKTIEELGRALVRQNLQFPRLSTIKKLITKWESRIHKLWAQGAKVMVEGLESMLDEDLHRSYGSEYQVGGDEGREREGSHSEIETALVTGFALT